MSAGRDAVSRFLLELLEDPSGRDPEVEAEALLSTYWKAEMGAQPIQIMPPLAMVPSPELRLRALEEAGRMGNRLASTPEEVVKRASAYLAFLQGEA